MFANSLKRILYCSITLAWGSPDSIVARAEESTKELYQSGIFPGISFDETYSHVTKVDDNPPPSRLE
jgi:hypothetical protein